MPPPLAGGRRSLWAISPLGVVIKAHILWVLFWFLFFFPPCYVALWDSKTPHRQTGERVSWCLETFPLSQLPPQDGSLSLTLLPLFLSFIFCPTFFGRECVAFLGAWCPPPVFRSCFVEVTQHLNDLLMNLWGRKWSPCPILPSWDCPSTVFFLINFWLCWVFVAAHRLSLVAVSGGYSSLQFIGFSLWGLLLLNSTGSRVGISSCGSWA